MNDLVGGVRKVWSMTWIQTIPILFRSSLSSYMINLVYTNYFAQDWGLLISAIRMSANSFVKKK